jgi:hypothetical protein
MDAVALLGNRVRAVSGAVRAAVEDVAGQDWSVPVAPGTSPIGLTLWHLPRVQDWLVQTTIRGAREVVDRPEFAALPDPDAFGFGTGLSPEQAKEAAAAVDRDTLLAYADAVADEIETWLSTLTDADLDRVVPEFMARQQARRGYCTPAALEEVEHLPGLPIGALLLRPAISHVFMHLGEIETLTQLGR